MELVGITINNNLSIKEKVTFKKKVKKKTHNTTSNIHEAETNKSEIGNRQRENTCQNLQLNNSRPIRSYTMIEKNLVH